VLRDAARDHPAHLGVLTNHCVALNYAEGTDPAAVFEAHVHFGRVLTAAPGGPPMERHAFANPRDPERLLRVGVVSSDLFDHSVAYFVRPMLEHRDRSKFAYTVYATGPRQDAVTRQVQSRAEVWRDMARANDQQLIGQIRADGIDILIELSGQTQGNRLAALRLRGAPVQVSYIGYPNTTGVPAIDYRIVDSLTDPAGAERLATESLIRLDPCFLCYTPREDAPRPGPPACLRNGYVTFGSFNSVKKLTPGTITLWCRLLAAVPHSRLLIKSGGLSSERAQAHIRSLTSGAGIDDRRVELLDKIESKSEHLAAYDRLDVALDTSPYNGTTTTCEALWQGVPVVSLVGNVHAARVGLSLLSAVGHPEWAVSTPEEFIRTAAALAADAPQLKRLRGELRTQMATSPLGDAPAMGRRISDALRSAWRDWCRQTP
jgi:predicted O-linked N-acetylglucosamine transferase (SPINDLY family)